jgi:F0F1-type ATP synthase membrane subunit c/vacuolar-type H+-ATPase subunit K
MAQLEALVLFLLAPAGAFGIGALFLVSAHRRVGSDPQGGFPFGAQAARGRLFPLVAVLTTPVIFGLILWWLSLAVVGDFEEGTVPGASSLARLHLWSAVAFGWAAVVTIASEAWVARHRMRQALGIEFGRVLPLVVIPETLSIFALILAFLIVGVIGDVVDAGASLPSAGVDATVLGLVGFAVSTLATPLGIVFSNRVKALDGKGFIRALLPVEAGAGVAMAGLLYAFLQIQALAG